MDHSKPKADSAQKPTIGLVLGSGAARGLAHIGVIEALEEAEIPIHAIAGSSIGAVIGAGYAAGRLNELKTFAAAIDWRKLSGYIDFNLPQQGLLEGRKWSELIRTLVGDGTFEELAIPLKVIATELLSGSERHISSGSLVPALRASTSLPGLFVPFTDEHGSALVDGGLTNPVPVDVARAMGADLVIAVNLNTDIRTRNRRKKTLRSSSKPSRKSRIQQKIVEAKTAPDWLPKKLEKRYLDLENSVRSSLLKWLKDEEESDRELTIFDVIANSINIMEYQITRNRLATNPPELLIEPQLDHLNLFDYHEADRTIEVGYEAMKAKIPVILEQASGL